jgi:hypothetical protein
MKAPQKWAVFRVPGWPSCRARVARRRAAGQLVHDGGVAHHGRRRFTCPLIPYAPAMSPRGQRIAGSGCWAPEEPWLVDARRAWLRRCCQDLLHPTQQPPPRPRRTQGAQGGSARRPRRAQRACVHGLLLTVETMHVQTAHLLLSALETCLAEPGLRCQRPTAHRREDWCLSQAPLERLLRRLGDLAVSPGSPTGQKGHQGRQLAAALPALRPASAGLTACSPVPCMAGSRAGPARAALSGHAVAAPEPQPPHTLQHVHWGSPMHARRLALALRLAGRLPFVPTSARRHAVPPVHAPAALQQRRCAGL